MREEIKQIKSGRRELRNFGIVIGLVLFGIGFWLLYKQVGSYQLFFSAGGVILVLGFVLPSVLKPLYWPWMILAVLLGWVMTRVILSVIFFLVITPIGLVARISGSLGFERSPQPEQDSYWCNLPVQQTDPAENEKQY
ncbi:MAG: hypothetical protein D6B25_16365 [Desulfobulbaceae bacterium]|nr:MAG: hypothetical protein D6B25_16365 [Desulfobulbaceae bacterium]